jgi:ribose transport system substrate-binding protein
MTAIKHFGAVILVIAVTSGMISCREKQSGPTASGPAAGDLRIALLMKARTNPFFEQMAAGAERAASQLGVSLQVMAIDKETDTAGQAAQVETAIGQGVRVILIAPADSKAIIAPLLQAQARGIKIINLDNRIDPAAAKQAHLKVETFIGPDNAEGARKSTEALIEKIGGAGKLAMLEGIRGVDNAENRKKGFLQAVEAAGGKVQVVAMDTAEWATEPAQKKMEAILNSHPDLAGVFCANDMMALGAIQAIASAGKAGKVVVTGYDNLKAAQQAIRAGTLHATVEQHPDLMGELGVKMAIALAEGKTLAPETPVPTDPITAKDLADSQP